MYNMMERIQIYLDAALHRQIGRLAAALGTTQSELIREGVRRVLRDKGGVDEEPLMQLRGLIGRSGRSDISERHDAYLASRKRDDAA